MGDKIPREPAHIVRDSLPSISLPTFGRFRQCSKCFRRLASTGVNTPGKMLPTFGARREESLSC
jgi:hypothetical protein